MKEQTTSDLRQLVQPFSCSRWAAAPDRERVREPQHRQRHAHERGASSAGRTHRGAPLFIYMRLRMWMTPPFWGGDVGAGAAPTCAGLDGTTLRHMRHSMSPLGFPTPWIGVYAMKGVAQLGRIEETHETNTQIDVRPGFAAPGRNPLHSVAPAWPAHQPLTPVTIYRTGRASLLSSSTYTD